jgi:hypothetical protein
MNHYRAPPCVSPRLALKFFLSTTFLLLTLLLPLAARAQSDQSINDQTLADLHIAPTKRGETQDELREISAIEKVVTAQQQEITELRQLLAAQQKEIATLKSGQAGLPGQPHISSHGGAP